MSHLSFDDLNIVEDVIHGTHYNEYRDRDGNHIVIGTTYGMVKRNGRFVGQLDPNEMPKIWHPREEATGRIQPRKEH